MTRPRLKSSTQANQLAERKTTQRPAAPSPSKPSRPPGEPQEAARAAMAHEPRATPSGDKVKLTLSVSLSREQAEHLTARAIREGKNLDALVAEILEGA